MDGGFLKYPNESVNKAEPQEAEGKEVQAPSGPFYLTYAPAPPLCIPVHQVEPRQARYSRQSRPSIYSVQWIQSGALHPGT